MRSVAGPSPDPSGWWARCCSRPAAERRRPASRRHSRLRRHSRPCPRACQRPCGQGDRRAAKRGTGNVDRATQRAGRLLRRVRTVLERGRPVRLTAGVARSCEGRGWSTCLAPDAAFNSERRDHHVRRLRRATVGHRDDGDLVRCLCRPAGHAPSGPRAAAARRGRDQPVGRSEGRRRGARQDTQPTAVTTGFSVVVPSSCCGRSVLSSATPRSTRQ